VEVAAGGIYVTLCTIVSGESMKITMVVAGGGATVMVDVEV